MRTYKNLEKKVSVRIYVRVIMQGDKYHTDRIEASQNNQMKITCIKTNAKGKKFTYVHL